MTLLLDLAFIIGLIILVPSIFFIVEVFAGIKRAKPKTWDTVAASCAILMPAHDEEQVLAGTLSSVKLALAPSDRIVVIADNCSDKTAEIARAAGCEVIERTDPDHRGKGYALAFGVAHLRNQPPDIAIIIDADCTVDPQAIARLKQICTETGSPAQANYLLYAPAGSPPQRRISEFAIYLKNHIRTQGLCRLGGSIPVTGSGFALPFPLLEKLELATGEIVEDMKMGLELALSGAKVQYVPEACITSPLPKSDDTAERQRQRWEHGHMGMITHWVPRLTFSAFRRRSRTLAMTALDMSILPFTLLLVCNLVIWIVALLMALVFADARLLVASSTVWVLLVASLLWVNALSGRADFVLSDLAYLPGYIAQKIKLYLMLLTGKKSLWVKAKRDD